MGVRRHYPYMGLDALIFCDCYEKGRLLEPPPMGVALRIEPDGSLGRQQEDGTLASDLIWDEWRRQRACEHEDGILLHHYLGNISLIGFLRAELQPEAARYPVLVTKVIYSGSHAGDFLCVEQIPALQQEVENLREFRCTNPEADKLMSVFQKQMMELATTALSITKPIAF